MTRRIVLGCILALAGCGASGTGLCETQCACEACTDAEHEECQRELDERWEVADQSGCSAELDEALRCAEQTGTCEDGDFDISCDAEEGVFLSCATAQ
jgi:hypothetical protein